EFRSRLFVELSEEQPPPMGALVSAAEFDGVKLRRRRRIVQIVGGTAGVTAVAFAATAVAGGIGTGQATASAAAGGTSTPAAAPVGPASNTAPGYSATVFWNQGTIDVQYMAKPLYQLGCEASENQNGNVCYDYKLADGTEVNYFKLVGTAGATEVKAQKGQAN